MSKNKVFKPSGDWIKKSHVDSLEKYEKIYHDSCLLYTSPSPRDRSVSRMPSSA